MQFDPPLVYRLSTVLLLLSGTDTDTHICASSSDPFAVCCAKRHHGREATRATQPGETLHLAAEAH